LKTTSSAVNGLPSCQVTPRLSFQVTDLPSAAGRRSARRDLGGQHRDQVAVGVPAASGS
jgi:hypothetical protein